MDRITLLVADDEPIARTFLQRYVRKNSLPVSHVYEAANGREAVDIALKHSPNLALLDIRMPGINGLDAAAVIVAQRPEIRVVVLTAYDDFEYARSALRFRVADYLLKPLAPEALAAQVEKARREKAARVAMHRPVLREIPHAAPGTGGGGVVHPLVQAVCGYVDGNLGENLRLEAIAKAVHASPSHCSRTFGRYAGMSISEYIGRRREEKAKELLAVTYLPVTDIAGILGFPSSAYFASWFRRLTGFSPLQFRKTAGKSASAG